MLPHSLADLTGFPACMSCQFFAVYPLNILDHLWALTTLSSDGICCDPFSESFGSCRIHHPIKQTFWNVFWNLHRRLLLYYHIVQLFNFSHLFSSFIWHTVDIFSSNLSNQTYKEDNLYKNKTNIHFKQQFIE